MDTRSPPCDIDWMITVTSLFGWMMPGELKRFPVCEREAAITWAAGDYGVEQLEDPEPMSWLVAGGDRVGRVVRGVYSEPHDHAGSRASQRTSHRFTADEPTACLDAYRASDDSGRAYRATVRVVTTPAPASARAAASSSARRRVRSVR